MDKVEDKALLLYNKTNNDTLAVITGSIAEAAYGVPEEFD